MGIEWPEFRGYLVLMSNLVVVVAMLRWCGIGLWIGRILRIVRRRKLRREGMLITRVSRRVLVSFNPERIDG